MNTSILTIDPGTRYWGVSVFHGTEILTCMVKNLSAKDSTGNRLREVQVIFLKLCRDYVPTILVIEKPCNFWVNQSAQLGNIIGEVKRLARVEHVRVIEITPGTIRKVLCQDEHATVSVRSRPS